MVYLWRAVDAEGEVLDVLAQSKCDRHAALKLMRNLLEKYAFATERLVTDDLRSCGAAARDLGIEHLHERGRWKNIEPRIRICLAGNGSARCLASRAPPPLRNSARLTPPCTTLSTSDAISRQLNPTASPRRGNEHVARGRRARMKIHTLIAGLPSSRGYVTMPPPDRASPAR